MCYHCSEITKNDSFRFRVTRNERTCNNSEISENVKFQGKFPKSNNRYLTNEKLRQKLTARSEQRDMNKLIMHRKTVRICLLSERKKKLTDLISEQTKRGDISAINKSLNTAYSKGLLCSSDKTVGFIKTISQNLTRGHGRRYDSFSEQFYQVLKIWGGPRIVKFVSANLSGPDERTVRRSMSDLKKLYPFGFSKDLFIFLADLFKEHKEKFNIKGPVLVEQAEDETVIIKMLQYFQNNDIVVGSCGPKGVNHKCIPDYYHIVGNDNTSYVRLQNFYETSVVSHMARVIMLNPLHVNMPAVAVFIMPTCNRFTHTEVFSQWEEIESLYKQYLFPVTGAPLTGRASDGDSRRRKCMEMKAYSQDGERYKIDHQNFTATGRIKRTEQGEIVNLEIMDQDYIHCGKKLTYPLDHATRVLMLGTHMAHMNHLQLVRDRCNMTDHGLRDEDIHRQDRQNWASAQRLFFPKVQNCLLDIEMGRRGQPEDVMGTRYYLEICFDFVEIFCSHAATLKQRVFYASLVCNFLRIWRLWVYHQPRLTLKNNFLTRQCFQDVVLACHASVLLIKATRDFMPMQDVCLAKSGSDCCEDFFSQNGSFIMNKHNYTFGDMIQNLSSMNRLLEIRASPNGPEIPKGHKKQENIWGKAYPRQDTPVDMKAFPSDEEMVKAWDDGIKAAQQKCRELGMYNINDRQFGDDDPDDDDWFHQPHRMTHADERALLGLMADEEDDEENQGNTCEMSSDVTSIGSVIRQHLDEQASGDPKGTSTLDVPGVGSVYKSTIVSMMNDSSDLSKDRLRRVKATGQGSIFSDGSQVQSDLIAVRKSVGLYSDVGLFIKDPGKPAIFQLGRVQRMRNPGKTGMVEYIKPIQLEDTERYSKLNVRVALYKKCDGETFKYKYTPEEQREFTLYNIIIGVDLVFVPDENLYVLNEEDYDILRKFIQNENGKKRLPTNNSTTRKKNQDMDFDGRVVVEISPEHPETAGPSTRRSNRKRKLITYE